MTRRPPLWRRLAAAAVVAIGALAALPAAASAHGLVGREDLPISKILFVYGACGVLVVSFVGLAILWQRPRLEGRPERRLLAVPGAIAVELLLGLIGVGLFVLVVYSGFAGVQDNQVNFSPTFVLVIFWVGLVPLSLFFGDVFRALNPWRAVARAVAAVAGRVSRSGLPAPLPYPQKLGRWPATATILVFVYFELIHYLGGGVPRDVAIAALLYAAIQLVGMSVYGIEPWTGYADGFSVYYGFIARISPLRWERGTLYGRIPLSGMTTLDVVPGTVAFLCALIGTTSFDGFSQGPAWGAIEPQLTKLFHHVFAQQASINIADTIGMVSCVLIIYGLYSAGVSGMRRDVPTELSKHELAVRFAHSLTPIALAYVVAHYFSELAYQGQAAAYLASDPLGHGSDLFGTAGRGIDYMWVTATQIRYIQVGALVVGHVCGLMLAHDRALITFKDLRSATRSQYWMLAIMVAFTSLGLWLLFSLGT